MDYEIIQNSLEMLRLRHDVGNAVIKKTKQILKDDDINFTGNLSDSFHLVETAEGTFVVSDNKYAHFVEHGMAPGNKVNFDALKNWVEKKLGIPNEFSFDVTFRIYNKIIKEGIKPKRFFKKAIKKVIGQGGYTRTRTPRKRNKNKFTRLLKKFSGLLKSMWSKLKKNKTPSQTKTRKKRERRTYFKDSQGNKTRGYNK